MGHVSKTLLIVVALTLPLCGADEIVGCIKSAAGSAMVVRGSQNIPATDGMHLLASDTLKTLADGRLGAIFQDGTGVGLGPNTELKIEAFLYHPAEGKLSLALRLMRGVIAYFSGRIAKLAPNSVTIETPVGVIGLRGTHMAVSIGGAQ